MGKWDHQASEHQVLLPSTQKNGKTMAVDVCSSCFCNVDRFWVFANSGQCGAFLALSFCLYSDKFVGVASPWVRVWFLGTMIWKRHETISIQRRPWGWGRVWRGKPNEKWLRALGLFSLEKRRLRGERPLCNLQHPPEGQHPSLHSHDQWQVTREWPEAVSEEV